jgi:hypothetical protein
MFVNTVKLRHELKSKIDFIETEYVMEDGKYVNVNRDKELKDLKNENKALYDSLSKIENHKDIDHAVEFKYIKKYYTDTVYIADTAQVNDDGIFEFASNTDSIDYILKFGAKEPPKWYSLKFTLNEKFTIVNKNVDGINQTTIDTQNNGMITDVTVFNKKKTKFLDKISIGPQIGVGYGVTTNKFDAYVGFGISYRIY